MAGRHTLTYTIQSFNEELDYSVESIKTVEKILDYYFQDLQNCNVEEKPTENQVWSMSMIWGSLYWRSHEARLGPQYVWSNEGVFGEKTPHILTVGTDEKTFPINKVKWVRR